MKNQLLLSFILSVIGLIGSAQTELITNGNFSSSSGWTTSGNWHIGSPNTCYNSSSAFAFAGDASGNPVINEYGNLKQTVTIPSNATSATLSFYTSQNTQETVAKFYDYIAVYLYSSSGSSLLNTLVQISNLDASTYPGCQSYTKYSYDVSDYIGQTIQLWFHVYSDGGPKNTLFRVDDVSLKYISGCSTPSNPGNPTSNSPQAGSVTITRTGSPPSGVTWYWQGTSCGTSTSLGSGNTFPATSSGTYYIRAYNNTGGCWSSNCGSVNVNITATCTTPSTPGNPTSNSPQAGSVTITQAGSPPSGVTWYWQGTSCGTSTSLGSENTFTATSSGTYYIRAYNNTGGCWSTNCGSVNVTISSSVFLNGVDISSQNGTGVSWSSVYSTNHSFAYVRATKGIGSSGGGPCWTDPKFNNNMTSSNPNGIVLGAYHVALPEDNPGANGAIAEANYFYSVAGAYIGTGFLPPALDLEDPGTECNVNTGPGTQLDVYYNTAAKKILLAQWVNTWCNRIYTLSGIWPVLYVTRCHANLLVSNYTNGTINSNIKLWIATNNTLTDPAGSPSGYSVCGPNWNTWPWVFHQYFAPAKAGINPIDGNNPGMDQDVFYGDQTAFNNLVGGTITPPASLDCYNAINLTCGVPYNGTTVGGKSNVSTNGCNSWSDTGPERVHTITTTTTGNITATISNLNGVDLDVYILKSCNTNDCFGTVTSNADTYTNAPAGTYYILVDGYNGASGSYTLTVTANCGTSPTTSVSTTSLTDFGNVQVGTNASPQNFTVSGSGLTANITMLAPSGFQISTSSSSGFGSTVTLTQSGGGVSNTTIYARFSPTSAGLQSGNISLISSGATTKYVSVSGTGTGTSSYCSAGSTMADEYISNVVLGSINQSSGIGASGYEDFSSQNTNVNIEGNVSVEITLGVGYTQDQILIWVDWNHDGDYTDAGENVYTTIGNLAYLTNTINFTVPTGALMGTTRMRIRLHDTLNGPNATPCGNSEYGEVEDYSINVVVNTGFELAENNKIVQIYPNPVTNELTIELKGNVKNTPFEIINSVGEVVLKGNLIEKTVVQTSGFASGVYLLKLESGKSFEFKKIVKK